MGLTTPVRFGLKDTPQRRLRQRPISPDARCVGYGVNENPAPKTDTSGDLRGDLNPRRSADPR